MINDIATQTLASIVTNNSQAVPVLEKYNLDFCCKGKRTLAEACAENGLVLDQVTLELESQQRNTQHLQMPFTEMSCEQLIGYILIHHHFYVKQSMPVIAGHLEKVGTKHGLRFPYMVEVYQLFNVVRHEMIQHMHKEEMVLFPRIKQIEQLLHGPVSNRVHLAYINDPIKVMMKEHDHAGELLYRIRELTSHYEVPQGACTTFRVCLAELKEFEEDLHKHVHIENNHLFPKAIGMLENRTN